MWVATDIHLDQLPTSKMTIEIELVEVVIHLVVMSYPLFDKHHMI